MGRMAPQRQRYIGVTVLCDYVLSEGVEAVLANLHRVGASAVAVNPTVTTEAEVHPRLIIDSYLNHLKSVDSSALIS